MLRLQAESPMLCVGDAVTPDEAAIEEVAGIELDAGLRGFDRQLAAAHRISNDRCKAQNSRLAVQHPVEVISLAALQLLVVGVNTRADYLGLAEIHRRAGHRREFARRNQSRVNRGVAVGV